MKIALICDTPDVHLSVEEVLMSSTLTESWQLFCSDLSGDVVEKVEAGSVAAVLFHLNSFGNVEKKFIEVMNASSQAVPVIALVNNVSESDISRLIEFGIDDYLRVAELSAPLLVHVVKSATHRRRLVKSEKASEINMDCADLIGSLDQGVMVVDDTDTIHFANAAAKALLGSGNESLAGQRFKISIKCGQTTELLMDSGGFAIPVEFKKTQARWKGELAYLLTFRDVTDRYSERARAKSFEKYGQKKEDFLASICHEIRTPLNAVANIGRKLSTKDLGPESADLVKLLKISTDSLTNIINDIRDLAKIQSGTMRVDRTVMSLKDVIRDSLEVVEELANSKSLVLDSELAPNVPNALAGDPLRIRQIIINFLTNALKFTKSGAVSVKAWEVSRNLNQSLVRIEVCDTGIGIPQSEISTLFQPYSQTRLSRKKHSGTGLGLSICRRLAELMGGQIGCRSVLGEGSTFWVELPFEVLATDRQRKSLAKTVELPICKWKSVKLGKLPIAEMERNSRDFFTESIEELKESKILVVDDNKINRELIRLDLIRLGHSVDVASDGLEAVRRASQFSYDMIILDLELPELDGFEAAKQIREQHKNSGRHHVPLIAWTASTLEGMNKQCNSAGIDAYFSKRYHMEELEGLCNTYIKEVKKALELPDKPEVFEVADEKLLAAQKKAFFIASHRRTIPASIVSTRFSELCAQKNNAGSRELLDVFVSDTNDILSELLLALGRADQAQCEMLVHKMKGSCSFLGLDIGYEVCKEIEQLIHVQSWEESKVVYRTLQTVMAGYVRQAISALNETSEAVPNGV